MNDTDRDVEVEAMEEGDGVLKDCHVEVAGGLEIDVEDFEAEIVEEEVTLVEVRVTVVLEVREVAKRFGETGKSIRAFPRASVENCTTDPLIGSKIIKVAREIAGIIEKENAPDGPEMADESTEPLGYCKFIFKPGNPGSDGSHKPMVPRSRQIIPETMPVGIVVVRVGVLEVYDVVVVNFELAEDVALLLSVLGVPSARETVETV